MGRFRIVKVRKTRSTVGPMIAIGIGAAVLVGLFGYAVYQGNGKAAKPTEKTEQNDPNCWHSPVKLNMDGLERASCTSNQHVADGTKVLYETDPPTSGQHYGAWLPPGFYTTPQTSERLVHDLEHGNIVIYYNKARLSDADMAELKALTSRFAKDFQGVLAVPRADATNPVIVTAWETTLRLQTYDKAKVEQFVDAFRGRGPERTVR